MHATFNCRSPAGIIYCSTKCNVNFGVTNVQKSFCPYHNLLRPWQVVWFFINVNYKISYTNVRRNVTILNKTNWRINEMICFSMLSGVTESGTETGLEVNLDTGLSSGTSCNSTIHTTTSTTTTTTSITTKANSILYYPTHPHVGSSVSPMPPSAPQIPNRTLGVLCCPSLRWPTHCSINSLCISKS